MIKRLFIFLALTAVSIAAPYTFPDPPPSGLWDTAGKSGGIPAQSQTIFTTITATGSDQAAAINAAIDSCPSGQVVKLAAGTFLINSGINMNWQNSGVVLRGSGKTSTIIDARMGAGSQSNAIFMGQDSYPWFSDGDDTITSGATKGSTVITIASTANYTAGQLVRVKVTNQENNAAITAGAIPVFVITNTGELYVRSQIFTLVSKTSTTLTLDAPLCFAAPPGGTAKVGYEDLQGKNIGLEDLTVTAANGATDSAFTCVYMLGASGCWLKNVKLTGSDRFNMYIQYSTNNTVTYSEIVSPKSAGGGPNGADIITGGMCHSLIYDNILNQAFPHIEVNDSSTGNVIAYNFGNDSTSGGVVGAGLDGNHGPHNSYNLFEGNVDTIYQADGFFGTNSEDTVFRNWFTSLSTGAAGPRQPITLNRMARRIQIVGNLLGTNGQTQDTYQLGYPNIGNSMFTGTVQPTAGTFWADWANHFPAPPTGKYQELDLDVQASSTFKANYNTEDDAVPAGEAILPLTISSSLYLSSKPTWFFSLAWPAFDPYTPNFSSDAIPAGYRYNHSGSNPPSSGGATGNMAGAAILKGSAVIK